MSYEDFYNKYKGQKDVGNTVANKGECVGLSSLWMDNFEITHVYGHAKDLYANAKTTDFAKIPNTPDAIVQKGDIVVWGAGYNGTYGHTGVATGKADVNTFECFEQNDPLGSTPHLKTYNYAYVIGWLRPKKAVIDAVSVPKADFERLRRKSDAYDYFCDKTGLDNSSSDGVKLYSVVENLKGDLLKSNKSLEKVEAERNALREKIDTLLQNGSFTNSTGSGGDTWTGGTDRPIPVPDVQPDSDNGGDSLPFPPTPSEVFWTRIVEFIKKLFGRR